MARVFAVQVQVYGRIRVSRRAPYRRSGVQAWSEPVVSPGADVYLRAAVRGHGLSRITFLSREAVVKSKNRDDLPRFSGEFINSTGHVRRSHFVLS